jgi:Carboxymuconolactone decarboxylase family
VIGHVGRALDNGVTPREIGEIITHLAFSLRLKLSDNNAGVLQDAQSI